MCAALNNPAFIKHNNFIRVLERTDSVSNQNGGLLPALGTDGIHDFPLRHRIDSADAVIQNHDRRILDKPAR